MLRRIPQVAKAAPQFMLPPVRNISGSGFFGQITPDDIKKAKEEAVRKAKWSLKHTLRERVEINKKALRGSMFDIERTLNTTGSYGLFNDIKRGQEEAIRDAKKEVNSYADSLLKKNN